VKNKVAPPFRTAEFDLMYSKGISKEGSLLDVAVEQGIVHKAGAWFTYKEEQIGQGRENAKAFLTEHPDVLEEIERLIRAALAASNAPEAAPSSEVPPPAEELPSEEEVDIVKAVAARAGSAKKK
jgi:recombination protein RecA